jgi:hypothetical protein
LDGLIIGVHMQFLKMLSQIRESDTKCQELNILILFSHVLCLKRSQIISDVLIAVWIVIQLKEHL